MLASGCQHPRQSPPAIAELVPHAGNYSRSNGYEVDLLNLRPDGSYTARVIGDYGPALTARGTWTANGTNVILFPQRESKRLRGYLSHLEVVQRGGEVMLVRSNDETSGMYRALPPFRMTEETK